jgi:hypothetical protein
MSHTAFTIALENNWASRRAMRRGFIPGGAIGGVGLVNLRVASAASSSGELSKSVVCLWHGGRLPLHEPFDPKIDLLVEMRRIQGAMTTSLPGLPLEATRMLLADPIRELF